MKVKPFKLKYTASKFKIKTGEQIGDRNITYQFMSKDGVVEANFFFHPDDVETRGIIWQKGNIVAEFGIAYPFANSGGGATSPNPKEILRTIINHLNRQEVKWLDSVPDE